MGSASKPIIDNSEPVDESQETTSYLAISRLQIVSRENAISDLYVRLPTGKMVKVARKGDKIDVERIERLGEKNVETMYVNELDYSGVVRDILDESKQIIKSQGSTPDQAVEKYFQVAEYVLTEVVKLPITEESIAHATEVVQEIAVQMSAADDMGTALRSVFILGDEFARHSMGSVVVSNWLARQMGWTAPRVTVPLTMGALLHDIGLKELPSELTSKTRLEMTPEEVQLYETHPTRGVMILRHFPNISADVLQIVQQHHEMPNGQGFPAHLRGDRIFPLAKVVSFANILAQDIIDTLIQTKEFSIERLHERIDMIYKPMYGSELCKAAKAVFKLRPKSKSA